MKHVDFFSRNPVDVYTDEISETPKCKQNNSTNIVQILDLHKDWLTIAQQGDDSLIKIITGIRANELDPEISKTYDIRNNVLYRKIERNNFSRYLPNCTKINDLVSNKSCSH